MKHCGDKHVLLGLLDLGNPDLPREVAFGKIRVLVEGTSRYR